MIKVLIDNGHGEETPGKRSPDGRMMEWAWNRDIAARLCDALQNIGIYAMRIVPEDCDIPLRQRVARINNICSTVGAKNCISVSIHINAAGIGDRWRDARGWSVFVAPNASQSSKTLAAMLYDEAEKRGLKGNRCVPSEHYWVQSLAMCRDTKCPAVLTENLFMDNRHDAEYLLSETGKRAIVDLHVSAIKKYIQSIKQ